MPNLYVRRHAVDVHYVKIAEFAVKLMLVSSAGKVRKQVLSVWRVHREWMESRARVMGIWSIVTEQALSLQNRVTEIF